MQNNTVIKVNKLGKKYRIGERLKTYKTLRDTIVKGFSLLSKNPRSYLKTNGKQEFWALKDISFEVKQGDVVGIIGHNGAGKSTLLKILSQITEPTTGYADIKGRIGSLLEVGTGFHQELTGRENIYLNGAILGMKKNDIDLRFDEIVSFAGVEKFIDTPIKHYSSGMNLRLGFAVAAHLEPDILLVDEVLAVGDLEFQRKCLNKMETVATEGRTVLFVSHNMGSIKELCQTALVLKNGEIDFHGNVVPAIEHYSRNILNVHYEKNFSKQTSGWVKIFINDETAECRINNNEAFEITADLVLPEDITHAVIHCFIKDTEGNQIVHSKQFDFEQIEKGMHRITAQVPPLYLKPGVYTLHFKLKGDTKTKMTERYVSERLVIDVTDKTNMFDGKSRAALLPPFEWSIASMKTANETVEAVLI